MGTRHHFGQSCELRRCERLRRTGTKQIHRAAFLVVTRRRVTMHRGMQTRVAPRGAEHHYKPKAQDRDGAV